MFFGWLVAYSGSKGWEGPTWNKTCTDPGKTSTLLYFLGPKFADGPQKQQASGDRAPGLSEGPQWLG